MKDLPERSTRGVRQRNLQGAAMEADMQFWNQDYFKELSEDDDFSDSHGSEPLSDSEDSDIDLPEDEPEQPVVIERPEKKEKVRRTVYLDPAYKKRKPKKKTEPPKDANNPTDIKDSQNAQNGDSNVPAPPPPKPKVPAPPLEVKLRASTQYKSMVSATQRQFEVEMEEASSRPRKKAPVRRMTQSQMLRQCITTEVENTISLHEILKEEEKKKTVTKKKLISGNRICILSNATHPYSYLFSSPSLCPEWSPATKPENPMCIFGDGPARYLDPRTGKPYCSLQCGKRLREEYKNDLSVTLHLTKETPFQANQPESVESMNSAKPEKPEKPIDPMKPTKSADSIKSTTKPRQLSPPIKPQTQPIPSRPMVVTTTTPQGQVVQYQLNVAKMVYLNSQAVNVPVNQNQVYYLQTSSATGEKSVQPHLMTGSSRMSDGNVYYCMVPMVPIVPMAPMAPMAPLVGTTEK